MQKLDSLSAQYDPSTSVNTDDIYATVSHIAEIAFFTTIQL